MEYWKTFTFMKNFDEKKERERISVNFMLHILEQLKRY